jgi:hypothetical protein
MLQKTFGPDEEVQEVVLKWLLMQANYSFFREESENQ